MDDDIIDVKDIDKVISEGLGMRYAFLGSLETAHLNAEGMDNYIDRYVYDINISWISLYTNNSYNNVK